MACLAFSVLFGLCQQENMLDKALDIIQSLVSIFEVRDCVSQILLKFSDFNRPTNTCVHKINNFHLILRTIFPSINASRNPMTARFLSI